jgi:hypothetical protein
MEQLVDVASNRQGFLLFETSADDLDRNWKACPVVCAFIYGDMVVNSLISR